MKHAIYYDSKAVDKDWIRRSSALESRLSPILNALNINVKRDIEKSIRLRRTRIHAELRSLTQLGKGDGPGMSAKMEISDTIPPPVLDVLQELSDETLWVLANRRTIDHATHGLSVVESRFESLVKHYRIRTETGSEEIRQVLDFLHSVNSAAIREATEVLERILDFPGDILGAYFFRMGEIKLFWIPIWLVANHLDIDPAILAEIVLTHEYAHLYSHVGQDADNKKWDTEDFAICDLGIAEGVAQFFTEQYCVRIQKNEGIDSPLNAFRLLMSRQPLPYRVHDEWVPHHANRAEVVRRALVDTRNQRIRHYQDFAEKVKSHGGAMHA